MEPLETEVLQMRDLLKNVKDANSMRKVLGDPDYFHDWQETPRDKFYNFQKFKTQYTYLSKWQSVGVVIEEKDDGSISYFYFGKEKPKQ